MNYGQSFRLALKSLATSKMRSILTMLGIIIGVASVIVILALGNGIQGMIDEQVAKLGINTIVTYTWGRGDGSTMALDPSDMYRLVEEHPDVLSGVSPYVSLQATIRKGDEKLDQTKLYGVSEVMFNDRSRSTIDGGESLDRGRFLSYLDAQRRQPVCVIGAYLAQELFEGDPLGQTLSIDGRSYTVIGILKQIQEDMQEGGSDDQLYLPYENALEILGERYVTLYMFTSTSGSTAGAAKQVIDTYLFDYFQDPEAYYIQTMEEQANIINAMMGVAIGVLVAIAAISLLVGGIGIMNIMLVSVTERTREIGIRKSLGAKRKDIRRQFVIEAGTTSAIGGLLGIGLGYLLATGVGSILGASLSAQMNGATFSAAPTPGAVLISFSVSVGIGILFGYLPANKAAKLNPIDALRYD